MRACSPSTEGYVDERRFAVAAGCCRYPGERHGTLARCWPAHHAGHGGILLDDGKMKQSAPQIEIAAGATVGGTVGFVAVPA